MQTATKTDTWAKHYATPSGFRHWPCEELVRSVGGRTLGRVLEAGCGNGANLWFLAEHADEVLGIDGNPRAVIAAGEYMRRRGVDSKVSVMHADIRKMPVTAGRFDALVDCMVSQHVPWLEYPKLFAEYRRVLRKDGLLIRYGLGKGTTMNGARSIEANTYDELPALFPGVGPVTLPYFEQLMAVLRTAGFEIVAARRMAREYEAGVEAHYTTIEAKAV